MENYFEINLYSHKKNVWFDFLKFHLKAEYIMHNNLVK